MSSSTRLQADPQSHSSIWFYHRAKGHADAFLLSMHEIMPDHTLDWTIVCPGGLTEDKGSEMVTVSSCVHGEGKTSRDTVAAAVVACLDNSATIGKYFSLLDGSTPLDAALRDLE